MLNYIDKPELNRAQVFSNKADDVINFVSIFNTVSDHHLERNYIKQVIKDNEVFSYIDVYGKNYKFFNEAIQYFKTEKGD